MVVDSELPCLLGQDIIQHPSVAEFGVNFRSKTINFKLNGGLTKCVSYTHHGHGGSLAAVQSQLGLCPKTGHPQPQSRSNRDSGDKKVTGLYPKTEHPTSGDKKDTGLHPETGHLQCDKKGAGSCSKTDHPTSGDKKSTGDLTELTLNDKLELLATKFDVKLAHDDLAELEQLADCLLRNADVFGDDENMGTLVGEMASLPTKGDAINIPPRKYNPVKCRELEKEIQRLKRMGIITTCSDNKGWNSPLHLVPKDDGRWRVTVDFSRSLNKRLTELDPYPQPSIDSVLHQIEPGAKYFSNVDLLHGYWQIKLDPADMHKTAFFWNEEVLMFTRLPMGLTCAGNIFSRLVAKVLGGADLDKSILKYLDDLCVVSTDFASHLASIDKLFGTLRSKGLKIKGKKCQFLATGEKSVKFLGRCVGQYGMRPDPDYVRGIDHLAAPTTKKELEKLAGNLVWVKTFVSTRLGDDVKKTNFSQLMDPIFRVKREKAFLWTDEAQKALDKLKARLKSPPIIGYADFTLPFLLTTDASAEAAGGCLMQKQGDEYVIIGHCSKLFNSTERGWSTIERELFAIKFAIETFDYFLSAHPFVIQTDHKPLCWVDKTNFNGSHKLRRWQNELQNYRFCIQYIKGADNRLADWLSRPGVKFPDSGELDSKVAGKFCTLKGSDMVIYLPSWCCPKDSNGAKLENLQIDADYESLVHFSTKTDENDRINTGLSTFLCQPDPEVKSPGVNFGLDFAAHQLADHACFLAIQALEQKENRVKLFQKLATSECTFASTLYKHRNCLELEYGARLLTIRINEKRQLVVPPGALSRILRGAHSTAHLGVLRTTEKLESFWWPGKSDDIRDYVKSCLGCAHKKGRYGMKRPKNGAIEKGLKPFDVLYIDYIQLEPVRGFKYAMTAQCGFTRWTEIYPVKTNTALDTVKCLTKFIRKWGRTPGVLSSDRGVHFTAKCVEKLCKDLGIMQKVHCAWRPESSGSIERAHRTIKNALYCASFENKNTWLDNLDEVQSALNSCRNMVTKVSPFYTIFGREYQLPQLPTLPDADQGDSAHGVTLAKKLRNIHRVVHRLNEAADQLYIGKSTGNFDGSILTPGQEVLVFREHSVDSKSSHLPWIGPYTVISSNELTAKLRNPRTLKEDYVSRHHIKPLVPRPSHLDDLSEASDDDDLAESGGPVDPGKSYAEAAKIQPKPPLKNEPVSPPKPAPNSTSNPVPVSNPASQPSAPGVSPTTAPTAPTAPPPTTAPTTATRGAPTVPAPRRSSRQKKQTKQLQLDPSKRSYND